MTLTAAHVKTLRKTDPQAAARLQKHLKRKLKKQKTKQVVTKKPEIPNIASFNEVLEEEQPEEEFVAPSIDQQLQDLQRMLRVARGLPEQPPTEDEEIAGDGGSSTESEPEEQDTAMAEFAEVFKRHQLLGQRAAKRLVEEEEQYEQTVLAPTKPASEVPEEQPKPVKKIVSKKKLREMSRPAVADLKMACARPDVVEVWDATAPDPYTLVWLKGYRNTVKVPIHWNQKRKYLSGKRAIEKPPFRLPEYIEQTKISEIRAAILERESQKSLKQKQREKSRPKSSRMHVDFRTLHDAFFKYATKPDLTAFGELYFEGKEREEKTRQFKPGQLSSKLKEALSIVLVTTPPPWLTTMQRYGPPASYPNLKIPGLNAPLPVGAQWGFHAGGWGKPPSDQFGNPLYPEVFAEPVQKPEPVEMVAPSFWGEIIEGTLDSDEEELEEEEELPPPAAPEEPQISQQPAATAAYDPGVQSAGFVTPSPDVTRSILAQRLEPVPTAVASNALFPSTQTYKLPETDLMTPLGVAGLGGILTPSNVLAADVATLAQASAAAQVREFSPESIKEQLETHQEADRRAMAEEDRPRKDEKKKKNKFKF